jgi:hypothetical protein
LIAHYPLAPPLSHLRTDTLWHLMASKMVPNSDASSGANHVAGIVGVHRSVCIYIYTDEMLGGLYRGRRYGELRGVLPRCNFHNLSFAIWMQNVCICSLFAPHPTLPRGFRFCNADKPN